MNAKRPHPVDDPKALVPFGWAPGGYYCAACSMCGEAHADSDKRSLRCQDCAKKLRDASMTAPMPETMSPREKVADMDYDKLCDRVSDEYPNTLAALASSGDHAELADTLSSPFNACCYRDRCQALIAEVAALRETNTEAERKLAEADQVIRDIADTPYSGADWPRSRAATYLASKEAERG